MARIVQKFGGTSVADLDRIRNVAQRVKAEVDDGHQVAVVVSAMSGTTNKLVEWATHIGAVHDAREYDTIVATGEQVTVGLLAIALQNLGVDARSWLGWQVPIHTDDVHGAARIEHIEADRLDQRLSRGQVAVLAGFQGIGPDGRITTLGRGGSDTSAVAIAAALQADRCDIYTDVDGVYTTDPRTVSSAALLSGCVTVAVTVALTVAVAVAVSATVSAAGDTLCTIVSAAVGLLAAAGAVSIDGASPVSPSSGCIPAVVVELLSNASVVAFFSIMPGRELSSSTAASSLWTVASSVFGPLNQYQPP